MKRNSRFLVVNFEFIVRAASQSRSRPRRRKCRPESRYGKLLRFRAISERPARRHARDGRRVCGGHARGVLLGGRRGRCPRAHLTVPRGLRARETRARGGPSDVPRPTRARLGRDGRRAGEGVRGRRSVPRARARALGGLRRPRVRGNRGVRVGRGPRGVPRRRIGRRGRARDRGGDGDATGDGASTRFDAFPRPEKTHIRRSAR